MIPALAFALSLVPFVAAFLRACGPWCPPLAAYGLIGYGAHQVYAPAGWLSVGCLLWLDLFFFARNRS